MFSYLIVYYADLENGVQAIGNINIHRTGIISSIEHIRELEKYISEYLNDNNQYPQKVLKVITTNYILFSENNKQAGQNNESVPV